MWNVDGDFVVSQIECSQVVSVVRALECVAFGDLTTRWNVESQTRHVCVYQALCWPRVNAFHIHFFRGG